ncbi:transmembrane protein fend [Drosophila tropicalis]|uniref:transmembrane protein fend n=1 Tax=Drosophila tropicalis TaxID=46794 RepID=UPI0035ABD521
MFNSIALIACALAAMCLGLASGLGLGLGLESPAPAASASTSASVSATTTTYSFSTNNNNNSKHTLKLSRCRQSCYQQFSKDWHRCTDFVNCRNCWQNCQQQQLATPFQLSIHHAVRRGALVLTDVRWDEKIANASRQCLITWEVSGGGLMGNLLTDTARAELSLWPDTEYNIQVTCKHKLTGVMRRSMKLNVDTRQLVATTTTTTTTTVIPASHSLTGESKLNLSQSASHPTDRVYIISSLPTASQLSGVVYPAFGALAFFLALLVMFLFLRPQPKRLHGPDGDTSDTASLLSRRNSRPFPSLAAASTSTSTAAMENSSTLHV